MALGLLTVSARICLASQETFVIEEAPKPGLNIFEAGPRVDIADDLDLEVGMDVSVRKVESEVLPDLVLYRGTNATQHCRLDSSSPIAENIVHKRVYNRTDGTLFVLHRHIYVNSERCGQNKTSYMSIYPSNLLSDANTASAANLTDMYQKLQASTWASIVFSQITASNAA